jgi:microcystin-dependent protein
VPAPFLGEVRVFAGDFAPAGWSTCDGTELAVAGNEDLFAVLGSAYGGDGATTFRLPDLRGRAPMHRGQGPATSAYARGEAGGVEGVALVPDELPVHAHGLQATTSGGSANAPAGSVLASPPVIKPFRVGGADGSLAPSAVAPAGQSAAHENRMPFVAINYVMATGPEATSGDGPFVGEVRPLAGDVVPAGWARCDGQLLPVAQNPVLFSVVSTMYGGDGEAEFALPDLRGGVVIGSGQGAETSEYFQGTAGGAGTVALQPDELPSHGHALLYSDDDATVQAPAPNRSLAWSSPGFVYHDATSGPVAAMGPEALARVGSGAAHANYQPVLALTFVIALEGEIPSR